VNMPSDIMAEQSLLGSIIVSPKVLVDVDALVTERSFYIPANGLVFKAMQDVVRSGSDLDIVTLRDRLANLGQLDTIGGLHYLMTIADMVPTASHAVSYAHIVRGKAVRRTCIEEMIRGIEGLQDPGIDSKTIVANLIDKVQGATVDIKTAVHLDEIVSPEVEDIFNRKTGGRGISTGLSNIDTIIHGFRQGEFAILGARPSMGKSALAMQMANHMARSGVPILYVSIEMSQSMVAQRLLSYTTGIDGSRLANSVLEEHEKSQLLTARQNLMSMPFYVSSHSPCDITLIRSMVSKLVRTAKIKVVFVDYLQMIDGGGGDNRTREVGVISRGLKALAKELDVAVVALSSLSRRVESRDDKRPIMSDLRESGDIESDADLVTFLYRPMYYADPDQKEGLYEEECEFIVSKNRNGAIGTAKLTFFNTKATFDDAVDLGRF